MLTNASGSKDLESEAVEPAADEGQRPEPLHRWMVEHAERTLAFAKERLTVGIEEAREQYPKYPNHAELGLRRAVCDMLVRALENLIRHSRESL